MADNTAYPNALRDAERRRLETRRRAAGLPENRAVVAVGLSGGGIRSATFALGFFQGLARHRLVRCIDLLSTVSGGGYFGAFLGRLFGRESVETVEQVEYVLGGAPHDGVVTRGTDSALDRYRADVLRYLRENGRYLSPNGSGDTLLGGVILLRNLLSLHITLAVFMLFVLVALQLPYVVLAGFDWMRVPPLIVQEPVLVSPYVVPAVLSLFLLVAPTGWAYWLVGHQRGVGRQELRLQFLAPLLVTAIAVVALRVLNLEGRDPMRLLAIGLAGIGVLTPLTAMLVDRRLLLRVLRGQPGEGDAAGRQTSRLRQRVSTYHKNAWLCFAALFGVTLVDSLGATLFWHVFSDDAPPASGMLAGAAALLGTLSVVQQLITRYVPRDERRPAVSKQVIAWVVAGLLLGVYVLLSAMLAHGVTGAYALLVHDGLPDALQILVRTGYVAGVIALAMLLFGRLRTFVNRSGHHALYMARLTRAFLGASNPRRHAGVDRSVLHGVEGDDVGFDVYAAPPEESAHAAARAAPLHFVNVTVNETIDGRSQLQRRDRKGMGLAFGPCGMHLGVRHHLLINRESSAAPHGKVECMIFPAAENGYRVFEYAAADGVPCHDAEPLSLGSLVAISGAAFSTGLGSRTSLAISVLCALANIRLGYWWDSGIDPVSRGPHQPRRPLLHRVMERFFPVYNYLLAETLARFRGTSIPHWYLSDGGHFENMGGYELIRRRPRVMLLLDAEADADYLFQGLAGLIRKARIDFGAEITFLDRDALEGMQIADVFGTLDQLRRRRDDAPLVTAAGQPCAPCLSERHFALARIRYADEQDGHADSVHWLVYVKPTMTGDEPADLLEYLMGDPGFPHQSTSDQFFGEEQWESYRMLGEHMAHVLCAQGGDDRQPERWRFAELFRQPS